MDPDSRSVQTRVAGNRQLLLLVSSHGFGIVAEKAAVIGVLVHAYDLRGSGAAAFAAFVMSLALVFGAPIVGRALATDRPNRRRARWHLVQTVALAATATAALTLETLPPVLALMLVAASSTAIMRPAVAMLSPAVVRSADELVVANVWLAYASSSAALIAPALSAALLALGGAPAVLLAATCSAAIGASLAGVMTTIRFAAAPDRSEPGRSTTGLRAGWTAATSVPGGRGILTAGVVHQGLLTAMGVVAVVYAAESTDLGAAGPGLLQLGFGVGAFGVSFVLGRAFRRRRLAPFLLAAIAASGLLFLGLPILDLTPLAIVAFGGLGVARTTVDVGSRFMLQRSLRPDEVAPSFTLLQLAMALGGASSALGLQGLIAVWGVTATLTIVGLGLIVAAVILVRPLNAADRVDRPPLVEMALLRQVSAFRRLDSADLEQLARGAEPRTAEPDEAVVNEGDHGRHFYVIAAGELEVLVADESVGALARPDGFGEIALLADVPRTASVIARSPASLLTIDQRDFLTAVTGSPDAERAVRTDAGRLYFADDRRPEF